MGWIAHRRDGGHDLERRTYPPQRIDRCGRPCRGGRARALGESYPEGGRVHLHLGQAYLAVAGVLVRVKLDFLVSDDLFPDGHFAPAARPVAAGRTSPRALFDDRDWDIRHRVRPIVPLHTPNEG